MDMQLAGKRALVTGSSSGIGAGIARALAREGAVVVVHGRNEERSKETLDAITSEGATAYLALGDLATNDGAAQVASAVERHTGGLDILVNNIGGTESAPDGSMQGWFDVTPGQWAGAMEQNLISAVRMIHAFVPAMRTRGWGRVINISSSGAIEPPTSVPGYCAAKAGLLNMTVGLSKELARSGVTVNSVCPGCTRTAMFEGTLAAMGDARGWPEDLDVREQLFMDLGIFACTTERYGRPDEVAALVAFLASPLAAFVNGANYRIDGGQVQSVS
jgi:3-oxoacyl-[acyl-carrier protein] reductase